jgi:hypothetical protein
MTIARLQICCRIQNGMYLVHVDFQPSGLKSYHPQVGGGFGGQYFENYD